MGEPAGVGCEIALKTWAARRTAPFILIDDPVRVARLADDLGLDVPVEVISGAGDAAATFSDALPVLSQSLPKDARPGEPDPENASAVIAAIERAVELVQNGEAVAVVTNPIHKHCMAKGGFKHLGHTDFLGQLAGVPARPVMMLAADELRVVPVTIHVGLRQAVADLKREDIVATGIVVDAALRRDFAIDRPRLAVAGLNPHAGEDGILGDEEREIIAPAVTELRDAGIDVFGPVAADTLFHAAARDRYDAALCMYHDQALIPIKTIAFDRAVNVTLGLPFVRTSPDHGTALDIAGKGVANADSLIAALNLASEMARRRALAA
jgi:4-hydroxythreonine-4-phosphate dehydrogenase